MRVCLLAIAMASITGCYASHSREETRRRDGGGSGCGSVSCSVGNQCCELCDGETSCITLDLACPIVACDGCRSNGDCGATEYCAFAEGVCGASDGVCQARPTGCFTDCPRVCGCDGETYCNVCEAARAGASVASSGTCTGTGCDGCTPADYCDFGPTCGGPGMCARIPTSCDDMGPEVCGCDGVIYPNGCWANMSGVTVGDPKGCDIPDVARVCRDFCETLESLCSGVPIDDCNAVCSTELADCATEELSAIDACIVDPTTDCTGFGLCAAAVPCTS